MLKKGFFEIQTTTQIQVTKEINKNTAQHFSIVYNK